MVSVLKNLILFFGSSAKPCVKIKPVSHPEGDLCVNPQ